MKPIVLLYSNTILFEDIMKSTVFQCNTLYYWAKSTQPPWLPLLLASSICIVSMEIGKDNIDFCKGVAKFVFKILWELTSCEKWLQSPFSGNRTVLSVFAYALLAVFASAEETVIAVSGAVFALAVFRNCTCEWNYGKCEWEYGGIFSPSVVAYSLLHLESDSSVLTVVLRSTQVLLVVLYTVWLDPPERFLLRFPLWGQPLR